MKLAGLVSFAALLALCGCTQHPVTTTTTTTASAPARVNLGPANVVGPWSFDGTCASGDGMVLQPNGTASLNENEEGLWGIENAGRLVLLTQQLEPVDLDHHAGGGPAGFYAFAMHAGDQDHLSSDDERQHPITAKRCPSEQAPPPPD